MLEVGEEKLKTLTMDHHGLVAAVCKDLKIAERIDIRLGVDSQRIVSPGQAVVAMILNGLGFTNRRLYLTHQFFETKPIDRLLNGAIKAEDLTDYTLGHTLDELWEYGSSKLFGEVAFEVALENNLLSEQTHLDTTSLSVEGEYDVKEDPEVINITHGYSKDHRPDLKQMVLSLVVNGPSAMPIWMEPLDGNSSDKESFHETIKKVEAFKKQIDVEKNFKWIADAAFYAEDKLLSHNEYCWLTRVPETLTESKRLLEKKDEEINWKEHAGGYKTASFFSNYGGVKQRWLLVFSQKAYDREKKTLEKGLEKKEVELKKALWHLENELFQCEQDAKSALEILAKKYKLHVITGEIVPVLKHGKRGKPKPGEEKILTGYKMIGNFERDVNGIERLQNKKGRFILATNDLNEATYPDECILQEYKDQQAVERGFRFIKDPWFMVDSIFLKSPKRIEALMMVMTLCLMVYNIAQYKLRNSLKEKDDTLPNQLGKGVKNPTLRWIFQIMEGIGIVQFFEENICDPIKEVITNLNNLRKKIIHYFGQTACIMYGLIQENCSKGLGM